MALCELSDNACPFNYQARKAFCESVHPLVPSGAGQKGPFTDIVSGAIGPVIDAAKAIWMRVKDDDALMRKTIENELEAGKWPGFDEVKA